MSDEINPIPLSPAPTSTWAKLKKWWPSIPSAAFLATLVGVLWPHGKAAQQADMPLLVIYSGLQTNWEGTVQGGHDPKLPVIVTKMTNGELFTNMINLNVRRAEIYRTSLVGFKGPDGSIVPVAQAVVIAGSIVQTNGVDSTVLTQLRTNR